MLDKELILKKNLISEEQERKKIERFKHCRFNYLEHRREIRQAARLKRLSLIGLECDFPEEIDDKDFS